MPKIDYRQTYQGYWDRPDRRGRSSFADPEELADQVLATCGGRKLLDAGCGCGLLVRTLLRRGVDAYGMDVARQPLEDCNRQAPGRFMAGSVLNLPYGDGSFETVISTDALEHLEEEDVPRALAELYRVSRRFVFLRVATAADRDGKWHLTIRDRAWWKTQCFRAGFRKHPLAQKVEPYESLEQDGFQITLCLEKIPAAALEAWPLEGLAARRVLHMDMLRETGRRSDAYVARYTLASSFIRPGDVVLDVACGLGYGSAVLASGGPASRVIGVDKSRWAIDYAAANYGPQYPLAEFHQADAAELAFLPDRSVDLVVSFETLEHAADPEAFLSQIERVLKPAGRAVLSVPNQWVDETGNDPNPYHQTTYDWESFSGQIGSRFLLERAYAQVAGGGMKLTDRPRRLRQVTLAQTQTEEAEWWILVAMKDPATGSKADYAETNFPVYPELPEANITAFARDYDNPWLIRTMVTMGMRMSDGDRLEALARRVAEQARPGSADQGAALCVLAYRLLERTELEEAEATGLIEQIEAYHAQADSTPHAWRWRISNQYVAGRLWLALGRRGEANKAFLQCAQMDCLRFSPLLATKTVDAFFQAGRIALADGEPDRARDCWRQALDEAHRVLQGNWVNILGRSDLPAPFGLPEVTELADLATRCAYGLHALELDAVRPGFAWTEAHRNNASELESCKKTVRQHQEWIANLEYAKRWLEGQAAHLQDLAAEGDRAAKRMAGTIEELEKATAWHKGQHVNWKAIAETREQTAQEYRAWNEKLEEGKAWLEKQVASLEELAAQREQTAKQLTESIRDLEKAVAWHREQETNWKALAESRERTIRECRAWNEKLEEGKAWLEKQMASLESLATQREQTIGQLRDAVQELEKAVAWHQEQLAGWKATAESLEKKSSEQRAWNEELQKAVAWHQEQLAGWKATAESLEKKSSEQRAWNEELQKAVAWHQEQLAGWMATAESLEKKSSEQCAWNDELQKAVAWHQEQLANWKAIAEQHKTQLDAQCAWNRELEQGKAWLEGQAAALKGRTETQQEKIAAAEAEKDSLAAKLGEWEGLTLWQFIRRRMQKKKPDGQDQSS